MPFGAIDQHALIMFLQGARDRQLDLTLDCLPEHAEKTLADGFVMLIAPSLSAQFVFINADAGKGWLVH